MLFSIDLSPTADEIITTWRMVYPFTGIGPHAIFLPSHFDNHAVEYRLELVHGGERDFIPIVRESGTMGAYGFNRNWCVWSFYEYSQELPKMLPAFARFERFWAEQHEVDL